LQWFSFRGEGQIYEEDDPVFAFKDDIDRFLDDRIKRYPKTFWLYQIRGENYINTGKYMKAIDCLTKSINLAQQQDKEFGYLWRIKAYLGMKNYQMALKDVDYLLKSEKKDSVTTNLTTRAEIYEKLGEYAKAKKDLIVACDGKKLFACERLEKFNIDEQRGRNWVYFSTNQNQSKIYYDKSRVTKSKSLVSTWVRYENEPNDYQLKYVTIDCKGKSLSFSEDKKNRVFNSIAPDSIFQILYTSICNTK
jgi:tetratricopeptide (TPR) repeat protein